MNAFLVLVMALVVSLPNTNNTPVTVTVKHNIENADVNITDVYATDGYRDGNTFYGVFTKAELTVTYPKQGKCGNMPYVEVYVNGELYRRVTDTSINCVFLPQVLWQNTE